MSCGSCHSCGGELDIPGNHCSICVGTWGPKAEAEAQRCQYEHDMKKAYEQAQEELLKEQWEEYMREQEILFRQFKLDDN